MFSILLNQLKTLKTIKTKAFLGINVVNVLNQLKTLKALKTKAFWGINVFNVFKSNATALKSWILEPLCFLMFLNVFNVLNLFKTNQKH